MIRAIEHTRANFVAGLFADLAAVERYLARCPEPHDFRVVDTGVATFPVFMLEAHPDEARFCYLASRAEVEARLEAQALARDPAATWIYFNLYVFFGPVASEPPGRDGMGAFRHYHVDNDFLDNIREYGTDSLFEE